MRGILENRHCQFGGMITVSPSPSCHRSEPREEQSLHPKNCLYLTSMFVLAQPFFLVYMMLCLLSEWCTPAITAADEDENMHPACTAAVSVLPGQCWHILGMRRCLALHAISPQLCVLHRPNCGCTHVQIFFFTAKVKYNTKQ